MMTEVFRIKARKVVGGTAEGEALIADAKLSFWGEYVPITGKVILPGHPFFQKDLSSKIVIMREIKGSSSCEMALRLGKMLGKAPAGMININIECLAVLGCVVAKIPLMTDLEQDPFKVISTGDLVKIRADEGIVEVCKRPFAVSQ
jgi:predicted aconitase with swiveling domain